MSAYEEGAEACRRGDDLELNPFDPFDAQFDEWLNGWIDEYFVFMMMMGGML